MPLRGALKGDGSLAADIAAGAINSPLKTRMNLGVGPHSLRHIPCHIPQRIGPRRCYRVFPQTDFRLDGIQADRK
jgi:hypothetical protein